MNQKDLEQLCILYDLGDWHDLPEPVSGGLLHRVWMLQTDKGLFAVKELDAQIMQKPNIRDAYRRSEQFALEMVKAGIPTITALESVTHEIVQDINDITVIVYQWVKGTALAPGSVNAEQARLIGQIVGHIHSLHVESTPLTLPYEDEQFDWNTLLERAQSQQISWHESLGAALPVLIKWTTIYNAASRRLQTKLVMSHRDLDPKNVLWRDALSPVLIDWEAVGLTNPILEAVITALNWAGWPHVYPQESLVTSLLTEYRSIYRAEISQDAKIDALSGAFGLLGWLEFNMRRSLDETLYSDQERALGVSETLLTFNGLQMLWQNFDRWSGWIADSV